MWKALLPSAFVALWLNACCHASVVVIGNSCAEPVTLSVFIDGAPTRQLLLAPGDSRPIFANAQLRVQLNEDRAIREVPLEPDCAYLVKTDPKGGSLTLEQVGLGEKRPRPWSGSPEVSLTRPDAGVITIKVLVDDEETRLRPVWEPILRQRLAEASAIVEAHCGVRMSVVAVNIWDSDDAHTDLQQSLLEFEREVAPGPAQLAIGFSSQFVIGGERLHMGGTRGPLHAHILIREQARHVLETERLEFLVHELGHFLGATHSPGSVSVMRPLLGQGRLREIGVSVQFDAPNTLLMSLIGQQIRQGRVRQLSDLPAATRERMVEIYAAMLPALSEDPATGHYLRLLEATNR